MAGRGGRGAALLQALKEQEERARRPGPAQADQSHVPTPSQPAVAVEPPRASPARPAGRAALLQALIQAGSSEPVRGPRGDVGGAVGGFVAPPGSTSSKISGSMISSGPSGRGKAVIAGVVAAASVVSGSTRQPTSSGSITEDLSRMSLEKPHPPPANRRGTSGQKVNATANYIYLKVAEGKGMYEYEVTFDPVVDSKNMRFLLLREQSEFLGPTRNFDGAKLYLPYELPEKVTYLTSTHPVDQVAVQLRLTLKHKNSEYGIHFYNVLMNKIMSKLNLVKVGMRNYYNPANGSQIPQHKLEVWPGYVTAVHEYEGGLMLCCDVSHKVLRTQTVHDVMSEIMQHHRGSFKDEIVKAMIGAHVLTRYNNKMYRVDDIDWDSNPTDTFERSDGTKMSYVDYYKSAYNLDIRHKTQPMLMNNLKKKERGKEMTTQLVCLVPELCYMSGLTDDQRSNYNLMKDINKHTKLTPLQRQIALQKFLKNVEDCQEAKDVLANWGLSLDNATVALEARILPSERIIVGRGNDIRNHNADWGNMLVRGHILQPVELRNWVLIYSGTNQRQAKDFTATILQVSKQMGIRIAPPRDVMLSQRPQVGEFIRSLSDCINENLQFATIIMPTSRDDLYSAIKKLCGADKPVPSQVIVSRTLSQERKLRAVTQKIALQINCKLGGALWAVDMPVKNALVIGIDVYHEGIAKNKKSVMGFVAAVNNTLTQWFSTVAFQEPGHEIIDALKRCMMQALRKYHEVNSCYPDRIIVYRDGVSEGQFDVLVAHEIQQLHASIKLVCGDHHPKFSFVVVQKRINTRLYLKQGKDFDNPPPGTVMDNTITSKKYYDFFLVSQHVREGTVSPTHYVVLFDTHQMLPDHHQRLAYKMTHMYYNWPGTVRVPAPCQYAHKLAYLVGQSIRKQPSELLANQLHFL